MNHALVGDSLLSPVPGGSAAAHVLATRPVSIKGSTVGFLGNLKPNCDVLLQTLQAQVEQMGARGTMFREKASCSMGASEAILDEIAKNCQVAVVALGD